MSQPGKRLVQLFWIIAVGLLIVVEYGCSEKKDNSGNGSGVYYEGPMQGKGKAKGGNKGGE